MKALCAAGKNQELSCCGNIESTSCYDDPFISKNGKKSQGGHCQTKSVFAGPSFTVDIEFKDISYAVKVKGRGEIKFTLYYSITKYIFRSVDRHHLAELLAASSAKHACFCWFLFLVLFKAL